MYDEDDRTAEVADRLQVPQRILALVLASGWSAVEQHADPLTDDGDPRQPRRDDEADWFVAGTPPQLMLGLRQVGPPLLARADPGWRDSATPTLNPVGIREVPELTGCIDLYDDRATYVTEIRDSVLRSARRHVTWCRSCIRTVHRADTSSGLCHSCAGAWLGIRY